jgi:GDP/UDP-N,N'-diacetylbacillosamine 2-epimerase (hydrolysing)
MKVGILTSSRADFGVYLPLLKKMQSDPFFELEIIAFGTHLSKDHGYTVDQIGAEGFSVKYMLETTPENDTPMDISRSIGYTVEKFSDFWKNNQFDLIFALGDRYEMFAAVTATVPFNIKIAHLYGGETTLGAIDNVFRHSITLMSTLHFASTEKYKNRIIEINGSDKNVYNVGALSIDNLNNMKLLSVIFFKSRFNIDLSIPTILFTFHPETVSFENNASYILEIITTLESIKDYQIVITMPNADTMGNIIRKELIKFIGKTDYAIGVENFGTLGYLSCMKHCSFLLGNTSSSFVEAAFFPKWVINLGKRQNGRINTPNIFTISIEKETILKTINRIENLSELPAECNIYGNGEAADMIVQILINSNY